jgi:hypothetical protein
MKHYSKERKDAVLKRMMQPENAWQARLPRQRVVSTHRRAIHPTHTQPYYLGLSSPQGVTLAQLWQALEGSGALYCAWRGLGIVDAGDMVEGLGVFGLAPGLSSASDR